MTFSVTPVLFNVGINEHATLAGRLGHNGPQEKNNVDNFKILHDYHRRFAKLNLPPSTVSAAAATGIRGKSEFLSRNY